MGDAGDNFSAFSKRRGFLKIGESEMKKTMAAMMLALLFTVSLVGVAVAADGAIHNPKNDQACLDKNGKWIDSKDCDPTSCGCLFHEIGEYIKGLFD